MRGSGSGARVVEEDGLLGHNGDRAAQAALPQLPHVDALQADGARLDIVQPHQDAQQR